MLNLSHLELRRGYGKNAEILLKVTTPNLPFAEHPEADLKTSDDLSIVLILKESQEYFSSRWAREQIAVRVNGLSLYPQEVRHRGNELSLMFSEALLSHCLHRAKIEILIKSETEYLTYRMQASISDDCGKTSKERNALLAIEDFVLSNADFFLKNAEATTIVNTAGFLRFKPQERVKEIAELYTRSLPFFRTNARFKLSSKESIEPFEHIRSFTGATLRYMVTNPYELQPSTDGTGISINGRRFTPVHALVQSRKKNFNIYENRVVLSFLKTVHQFAEQSSAKVEKEVLDRLRELLHVYESHFSIKGEILHRFPKPTPVITSVDAYRRFYIEISRWFIAEKTNKLLEAFVSDADTSGRIYEYYCLLKILRRAMEDGWNFKGQERVDWDYSSPFYREEIFSNAFYFERGGLEKAVFFEPVIHSSKLEQCQKIGLYRASRLRLNESGFVSSGEDHGIADAVYVPDFVIREEQKDGTFEFTIADAKYSSFDTVCNVRLTKFLLRYGFGIKPLNPQDRISAFELIYGKGRDQRELTSNFENPLTGQKETEVQILCMNEVEGRKVS